MSGLFISIEGIDGSGKTTQVELLKKYFEDKNYEVICTREPGGTEIGEKLREIIIDPEISDMGRNTEVLLYAAARAQLAEEVIIPALKSGAVVISDRFIDSSIAYQGYARGVNVPDVIAVNKFGAKGLSPDLTFLLRITPDEAMERKKKQKSLDRIEKESMNFHNRVFAGYNELSKREGDRIKVIDANRSAEDIHNEIVEKLNQLIKERGI